MVIASVLAMADVSQGCGRTVGRAHDATKKRTLQLSRYIFFAHNETYVK
jgi:hypothetical protein